MDFFNFSDPKEIGIMILVALLIVLFVVWVMRSKPEEQGLSSPRKSLSPEVPAADEIPVAEETAEADEEGMALLEKFRRPDFQADTISAGERVDLLIRPSETSFRYGHLVYNGIPIDIDKNLIKPGDRIRAEICLDGDAYYLAPIKAEGFPERKVLIEGPDEEPGCYKGVYSREGYLFVTTVVAGEDETFRPGQLIDLGDSDSVTVTLLEDGE